MSSKNKKKAGSDGYAGMFALVYQHIKAQLLFIKMACGEHVTGAETQMIDGHGLLKNEVLEMM